MKISWERLASVEEHVGGLRVEVGGLREEVGGLREEVGGLREEVTGLGGEVTGLHGKVGGLRDEVHELRVLGEENERRIDVVIEVQAMHGKTLDEHGAKLDEIMMALQPLAAIHAFVQSVAHNHEEWITELEKRSGIRR